MTDDPGSDRIKRISQGIGLLGGAVSVVLFLSWSSMGGISATEQLFGSAWIFTPYLALVVATHRLSFSIIGAVAVLLVATIMSVAGVSAYYLELGAYHPTDAMTFEVFPGIQLLGTALVLLAAFLRWVWMKTV